MTLALAVFVASVLGSAHCAAMCGGFVCLYAAGGPGGRPIAGALPHLAYNAGRLATYLLLGALAGAVGHGIDRAGTFAGIARAASVAAGTLLVVWGVTRVAALSGVPLPRAAGGFARVWRGASALLGVGREWPPAARAALVGFATTLLPCGWLYAFVATAAGTGSATSGALAMLAFWTGTLPMMLAVGVGARRAFGPLQRRLPALAAASLVVIGALTISGRLVPRATHEHSPPAMDGGHAAR